MNILVLNSGSSSLKFEVTNPDEEKTLITGIVDAIGGTNSHVKYKFDGSKEQVDKPFSNHDEAIEEVVSIIKEKIGLDNLGAIGHRVVHGGEYFQNSVVVDDDVIAKIEELSALAPLHNPANVAGIKACAKLMPDKKQVAVFDTAYHQTITPDKARYAIPAEYYEKHKIRKYGFHGTSHKYIAQKSEELFGAGKKIVSCHLGNGASICAIKDGKSVDTSMGFTPLAGLVMGTRCGDIDPEVISFLAEKENMDVKEVMTILNKKSGVMGICGDSDFRIIEEQQFEDPIYQLANDLYVNRIKFYIGAYHFMLDSMDYLVFTAGIGEKSSIIREDVCKNLETIGIKIDQSKNLGPEGHGRLDCITELSTPDSKIKVYVIPTAEELMIAKETKELL